MENHDSSDDDDTKKDFSKSGVNNYNLIINNKKNNQNVNSINQKNKYNNDNKENQEFNLDIINEETCLKLLRLNN